MHVAASDPWSSDAKFHSCHSTSLQQLRIVKVGPNLKRIQMGTIQHNQSFGSAQVTLTTDESLVRPWIGKGLWPAIGDLKAIRILSPIFPKEQEVPGGQKPYFGSYRCGYRYTERVLKCQTDFRFVWHQFGVLLPFLAFNPVFRILLQLRALRQKCENPRCCFGLFGDL